jgi:hypothetical protein
MNFYNKHTEVLKRIMDRHADDAKMGQELMRNRVRKAKAKNIREAGPDAEGLAAYKSGTAAAGIGAMGAEAVISHKEMLNLRRARGDLRAAQEFEVHDDCKRIIKQMTEIAKTRELTLEEARTLEQAEKDLKLAEEMLEVPDDAIQIDAWTHDPKTGAFGKRAIYTKAEAPEHIAEIQRQQAQGIMPTTRPTGGDGGGGGGGGGKPARADNVGGGE